MLLEHGQCWPNVNIALRNSNKVKQNFIVREGVKKYQEQLLADHIFVLSSVLFMQ
jgi:hypothetical protein